MGHQRSPWVSSNLTSGHHATVLRSTNDDTGMDVDVVTPGPQPRHSP